MASLSDKSGTESAVSIVSRKKPWADLNLKLTLHPIRKDVVPLKDDAAIKSAVKNLILTNFYERPFQPEKGANLVGLLFEPADFMTEVMLKEEITEVLELYEPRIKLLGVNIINNADRNAWDVTIAFKIIEFDINENVEIRLQRLR